MLLTALAVVLSQPSAQAAPLTPSFHSGDGLTLVSATTDGARTWHLVVSTAELSRPVRINVLLPVGYSTSMARAAAPTIG
jgi:hypothetical protein